MMDAVYSGEVREPSLGLSNTTLTISAAVSVDAWAVIEVLINKTA